jgi:hypothetical protein
LGHDVCDDENKDPLFLIEIDSEFSLPGGDEDV